MTEPQASAGVNYSVVPAVVTQNDDGDKLGRVKVRFPWMDERQESGWLQVAAPFAGKGRGFFFVPEVEDVVLVGFAYGQVDRGYVLGSLWSKADKPPADDRARRTIKSVSGHVITLDDTDDGEAISIVDKTGKNKIVIDSSKNTVTIESDGDLTIAAKGKLNLKSDDAVSITGAKVTIEADDKTTIKGSKVAINGPGAVTINDGALEVV